MTDEQKTKVLVFTGDEPRTFQKYGSLRPGGTVDADPRDVQSLILTGFFAEPSTRAKGDSDGKE